MNAAVFVAVICCLAAAVRSQNVDLMSIVREQLDGPAVQNVVNKVPEGDQCRANAGVFLRACTEDLMTTTSLKDDTAALIDLVSIDQTNNSLKIKGGVLAGYIDGAVPSDTCCVAACEVARKGCMCDEEAYNGMVGTFDLDGTGGIHTVFGKMVEKCTTGGRFFEAVMDPNSEKCAKAYAETAKTYTC